MALKKKHYKYIINIVLVFQLLFSVLCLLPECGQVATSDVDGFVNISMD